MKCSVQSTPYPSQCDGVEQYNGRTEPFELMNKISSNRMRTHGSREEGFRIYTRKSNVPEGKWRVETAVKDGPIVGSKTFYVKKSEGGLPKKALWKIR